MKKLFVFLCAIIIGTAFGETKNITWKVGDNTYATSTCEVGDDLIIPQNTPTKYGYHFVGWAAYTFLEYIESTGTQYIDTGVACNYDSYDFDITVSKPTGTYASVIFIHDPSRNMRFNVAQAVVVDQTLNLNLGDTPTTTTVLDYSLLSEPLHLTKHIGTNSAYGTVNNVAYNCSYSNNSYKINDHNIILMAKATKSGDSYTISEQFAGKLYNCVIIANNVLIRNLVPAKRNSDNTVGMYDTVTNIFFTNAGTGTFIAGPAKQ